MIGVENLPLWQCHKRVRAAKIASVKVENGTLTLVKEGLLVSPGAAFFVKHDPEPGGYLVVYDDGYTSYSPAAPFEAGYSLVDA